MIKCSRRRKTKITSILMAAALVVNMAAPFMVASAEENGGRNFLSGGGR